MNTHRISFDNARDQDQYVDGEASEDSARKEEEE